VCSKDGGDILVVLVAKLVLAHQHAAHHTALPAARNDPSSTRLHRPLPPIYPPAFYFGHVHTAAGRARHAACPRPARCAASPETPLRRPTTGRAATRRLPSELQGK
jgi:hypothetical protein